MNRGRGNFDEIRYEYFRDRTAQLEAVKAGTIDLREEFTSRDWATAYNIPAVAEGRLVKVTLPDENPSGAQGFFLNTRRPKLADVRVRKALDWPSISSGPTRTCSTASTRARESFFENSDMKAEGKPSPDELALLEPFRDKLPPEVFGEPYRPPVSDGSGPGPQAAARGRQAARGGGIRSQGRQARQRQGRGAGVRIPLHRSA